MATYQCISIQLSFLLETRHSFTVISLKAAGAVTRLLGIRLLHPCLPCCDDVLNVRSLEFNV